MSNERWTNLCERFGLAEDASVDEVLTAAADAATDAEGNDEGGDDEPEETPREAELRQRLERAELRLARNDQAAREAAVDAQLGQLVEEGYLAPAVRDALTPVAHLMVRDEELARADLGLGDTPVTPVEGLVSALRKGPQVRLRTESTLAGADEQTAMQEGIAHAVEAAGVGSE